jgi:hypothetical protein
MNEMNQIAKKSMGCGGCLLYLLGGILLTIALVVGAGYYTLMHTAYPLKKVAQVIEQTARPESPITIKNISGSFSTGARIKTLKWENGEVENLCITYDNLLTSIRSKRFIFREISVTKAHISVFEPDSASKTNEFSAQGRSDTPFNWNLFQIDKLSLADIFLTNRLTGFSIAIPKFEWTGFKWEKGTTEFGTIRADTDQFKIETGKATLPGFITRLTGTLRPRLHPSILKEFSFDAEIGPLGSNTPCRVTAFDDAFTATVNPDGTGILKIQSLNIASYFKDLWLQDVNLDVETQKLGGDFPLHIKSGSFRLGKTLFTVTPTTIQTKEKPQVPLTLLDARAEINGTKIQYNLIVKDASEKIVHQIKSQPELKPDELVALVLFEKSVADLTAAEKATAKKLQALLLAP